MKLTLKEKATIAMFRELHAKQRDALLAQLERQILANGITERVTGQKLAIADDAKVEKAFGPPPRWKARRV